MHCISCAGELPEGARFCLHCGVPQSENTEDAVDRWESARIVWQKIGFVSQRFEAEVTTPTGTYRILDPRRVSFNADRSQGPQRNDPAIVFSHRGLVERLIREGFEPVGVGEVWWAERFRRPAGTREYEYCDITIFKSRFLADALGLDGHYSAGETPKLPGHRQQTKIEAGHDAHAALVAQLEAEGWKRDGTWGPAWWQLRFKRIVSPGSSEDAP